MFSAISQDAAFRPHRRDSADLEHSSLVFTGIVLVVAFALQRFCVPVGSTFFSIVGPIGLLLAGYGLMRGVLVLDFLRLTIFFAFFAWIMLGGALRATLPQDYGTPSSWLSLSQFVVLTTFGLCVFAQPVSERRFFRVVNAVFLALAVGGVVQFVLQFVGLGFFSFSEFVPANLLLEGPYATVIPIGDGGYFKSNGLFLLEPSIFSQMMALAIIIEMLMFRRAVQLAMFAVGLVVSISGTGWLMMFGFVLTAAFSLGGRGIIMSLATVSVGVLALGGLALFFPSGFALFVGRTEELNSMGASGHSRFVTPWWLADFILSRTPMVALYGLGPGVTDKLAMQPAWDFNTNPPVKISLEYGLPCLLLYLLFLLVGRRTRTQKALVVPSLILLLVDGGYSQFPPVLFPVLLLISVADLVSDEDVEAPASVSGGVDVPQQSARISGRGH